MRRFHSLHILCEHALELFCCCISHPFFEQISISVKQVNFWLVIKAQRPLKITREWIVGIQVGELDLAKVLRFEPMNHGRHGTAGTSGKAEELHELELPGCEIDRGRVGGFEVGSA